MFEKGKSAVEGDPKKGWSWEFCISRRDPGRTVEVYRSKESEGEVTVLQAGTNQESSSRSESYQEF